MRDRVTISLYSMETNEPPGYKQGFLNEFTNIEKIRDGLVNAAIKAGRTPPEFVVSILLVPDWNRNNNSYKDDDYLKKKSVFLEEAKAKFETIKDTKVEDFYAECAMVAAHRNYMHGLKAMGSNADMIKTIAIINNADHCQHLQIDSNTIVPSFLELYNKTFGAKEQKDGINASYYDEFYVSAHNKMVYTTPEGGIAKKSQLHKHLWEWCRDHANDNNIDQDKRPEKNSIYARVFTNALFMADYVKKFTINVDKVIYPATLNPNVYWLTDCMVTALNMSWSAERKITLDNLKSLPFVKIGEDGFFNFQCFLNVIKKHTGDLYIHDVALGLNDDAATGEETRKLLLLNSNYGLELNALKEFYENAIRYAPSQADDLAQLFPNTQLGNNLTRKLFGCDVTELQESAKKIGVSTEFENPSASSSRIGVR